MWIKNIRCCLFLALASVVIASSVHAQEKITTSFERLANSHDLALSAWGPYSKHYAGISHLPDLSSGLCFDVTVVPGFYRSKSIIPNVLFESGYVPWDVDAQLTHVTYRYELEWKDRVLVDVTYTIVDEKTVLVEMRCVNQTASTQTLYPGLLNIHLPATNQSGTLVIQISSKNGV